MILGVPMLFLPREKNRNAEIERFLQQVRPSVRQEVPQIRPSVRQIHPKPHTSNLPSARQQPPINDDIGCFQPDKSSESKTSDKSSDPPKTTRNQGNCPIHCQQDNNHYLMLLLGVSALGSPPSACSVNRNWTQLVVTTLSLIFSQGYQFLGDRAIMVDSINPCKSTLHSQTIIY